VSSRKREHSNYANTTTDYFDAPDYPIVCYPSWGHCTAYREGLRNRLQAGKSPLAVSYLVSYLHAAIDNQWFDKRHEVELRQFVGFIFGEVHGKVLTLNGTRRPDVTTLVTLNSQDARRGYRAGREWFFFEATSDERAFNVDILLQRLHEYVVDSLAWHDPEGVRYYILACLLGELSGHLFPLTAQEQQAWEAERRLSLEKYNQDMVKARDTESVGDYTV
jgi:hypothetical protein